MKKTRENKGITLIALIITIIVMLILVGVSVNVALNGGLFDTAKTAAEKTDQAVQGEKDLAVYVELMAESDELAKRYPFNGIFGVRQVGLRDTNISDLYAYILEKYGATTENLNYSTAIKAANTFYEIYDREIQRVASASNRQLFWENLANPMNDNGFYYQDFTPTTEDINTRVTLQLAFMFSKNSPIKGSVNGIAIIDTKVNNVRHYVIGNPNIIFDTNSTDTNIVTINTAYNTAFPGGHFPIDAITGTAVSGFTMFGSIMGRGEICVLTEEIANSDMGGLLSADASGNTEQVDPKDYIGHTICLLSEQETGSKVARISA